MLARLSVSRIAAVVLSLTLVVLACGAEAPTLRDEDPLPVNSTWKGKFTQMGVHPEAAFPPELEAILTVTRRDGDNVEIELRETMPGMDLTFLCRGCVRRNADMSLSLEFRSYDVKGQPNAGFYLLDVPYTARLVGDTIKGAWNFVEKDQGIDLRGEYALTRE